MAEETDPLLPTLAQDSKLGRKVALKLLPA